MSASMSIGDFSRATKLSAKTLRFYHQVGLLLPARIDPSNGYRFYEAGQVSDAQVIRNFRALDMPVDLVRAILSAPDSPDRDHLIEGHLARMEVQLEATRSAVASLRSMLDPSKVPFEVMQRRLPPINAVVIRETINLSDLGNWFTQAMEELDFLIATTSVIPSGPRGGMWDTELFLDERGQAALFFPTHSLATLLPGRARAEPLPAIDVAMATHRGSDDTILEVYGALGRYVARHGISVDGPIRETYLEGLPGGSQETVTEIGWPIRAIA
ncbi:MerR family transcriptional regulator [Paeniglutamicibacter sp. MACA_103]|uniref:MerR family transcriptional regulator n=1 Tax=Paeniglutamicibacter sp. MACA_103 TaxID=3377337 RepID=UPI003894FFE5